MAPPQNRAAYLDKVGTSLEVRDAPLPTAGPGEIVIKNAAIAINPVDWHMLDHGIFIQQWPAIFGCDVAGEVYGVGPDVQTFKKGDRVIGHTINLVSGRPQDAAYQLFTIVPVTKAAILPDNISFTDGVVVPFALEVAVCALSLKEPGIALPGVSTPALGLPYPSAENVPSTGKTIIATAAGIHVIAIAGAHNLALCRNSCAAAVFDHKDPAIVEKVVEAIENSGDEFVGIFDAVANQETFDVDLAILAKLNGGHLALTHPPVGAVPENVKAGMVFAVNDIVTPVWQDFVTPALQAGKLKCLPPPTVIGKGLEYIQDGLEKSKAGVSGTKLVVEL